MKLQWRVLLLFTLAAVVALTQVPRLLSVEPPTGKPGDELVVKGQNLDAKSVTKLFLTMAGKDREVEMKEQTAESIRFAIPADAKPGRYNLTVQTAGPTPTIMEQPVFCTVEE